MIGAEFFFSGGYLSGFAVSGHAGGRRRGENIICAAVSSAAYLTANTLTDVMNIPAEIVITEGEAPEGNRLTVRVPAEHLERSNCILEGFYLHMTDLAEQYAKEITIDTMEV